MDKIIIKEILEKYKVKIAVERGNEWRCHCPFHNDMNASMSINSDTGLWKCFASCGQGSFFKLILKLENDYEKAKKVYDSYFKDRGIHARIESKKKEINSIYAIKNNLADILKLQKIELPKEFVLIENENDCPKYLLSRLNIETIKYFKLGACYEGKYKNRIIIPIYFNDELHGFQARDMNIDSKLRYLFADNFESANFIFNFDNAKDCNEIIITEGAFSAMSAYEKGYKNVIALFAAVNRLSTIQLMNFMKSKFKTLIIAYDNDEDNKINSGLKARIELANQLKNYYRTFFMNMPKNIDFNDMKKEQIDNIYNNRTMFKGEKYACKIEKKN